jgi:hypothetical protein
MNSPARTPADLQDVLYQFSIASEEPNAALLDEFVRHYPQYAEDLTRFAVAIVLDTRLPEKAEEVNNSKISASVSRAISKFQNALHQLRQDGMASIVESAIAEAAVPNPFEKYDRPCFRKLAGELQVNSVFLCKLRDRQVLPSTMTAGFVKFISDTMKVTQDTLSAFFSATQSIPAGQFYNAPRKPQTVEQQTFEEAVRGSGLSEEQQKFLLSL